MKKLFLIFTLFCSSLQAEISRLEYKEAKRELVTIAKDFIKFNSTEKDEKKWNRKFNYQIDEAVSESIILTENRYINEYIYDWLAARRNYKKEDVTKQDILTGCRFFLLYIDKELNFPDYIIEHINKKAVEGIKNFLKEFNK